MTNIYYRFDDVFASTVTYSLLSELEFEGATAFAWVSCGVAGDIVDSYNVSSVTDVGTGKIGVTYAEALPDPFSNTPYYTCSFCCAQGNGVGNNATAQDPSGTQTASRSDYVNQVGFSGISDPNAQWYIAIKAYKEGTRVVSP